MLHAWRLESQRRQPRGGRLQVTIPSIMQGAPSLSARGASQVFEPLQAGVCCAARERRLPKRRALSAAFKRVGSRAAAVLRRSRSRDAGL
jgi:hypothetical protein